MVSDLHSVHPAEQWFPLTRWVFRRLNDSIKGIVHTIGRTAIHGLMLLRHSGKIRQNLTHTVQQASIIGLSSTTLAVVLTTMAGMVLALQVATEMARQGGSMFVGALVSLALVRELGPILSGFAVIALAGSAFAAEISAMKANSQLDALEVLHVCPIRYLMLPRVLATIWMLPLITTMAIIGGIWGGMIVSQHFADIPSPMYLDSVWQQTEWFDLGVALLKAVLLGLVSSLICCSLGFQSEGTTASVGITTTRAVVWSFMALALLNYFVSALFYG